MGLAKMVCDKRGRNGQSGKMCGVVSSRAGQSMTSLLIGLAVMGAVGAGAAKLSYTTSSQEKALSAKGEAAALIDALADEIRTGTRYSDLESKYDNKTFDGDDEFELKTTVRKICSGSSTTNCAATHIDIEVVEKGTGESVLKQTVSRLFSSYEESHSFSSANTFVVPEDSIGMRFVVEGGGGNSGGSKTSHGYALRYHSGSCGTGYKVNSSGNGCTKITCPSGQVLQGDNCVQPCKAVFRIYNIYTGKKGGCSKLKQCQDSNGEWNWAVDPIIYYEERGTKEACEALDAGSPIIKTEQVSSYPCVDVYTGEDPVKLHATITYGPRSDCKYQSTTYTFTVPRIRYRTRICAASDLEHSVGTPLTNDYDTCFAGKDLLFVQEDSPTSGVNNSYGYNYNFHPSKYSYSSSSNRSVIFQNWLISVRNHIHASYNDDTFMDFVVYPSNKACSVETISIGGIEIFNRKSGGQWTGYCPN